jgi:phosphatidylglycerol lysyltransferase
VASIVNLPQPLLRAAAIAMLAMVAAYLTVIVARRGPIALWRYQMRLPSLGCGLMQISVASLDQALAAGVVYVLLPPDSQISFHVFLGVYVIAAPISLLSLVPGGLGVFETMVVALLVGTSKAALLGSLIAYRLIYFVLPFALAILLVAIHEIRRSSRKSGWPGRLLGALTRNSKRDPDHDPR